MSVIFSFFVAAIGLICCCCCARVNADIIDTANYTDCVKIHLQYDALRWKVLLTVDSQYTLRLSGQSEDGMIQVTRPSGGSVGTLRQLRVTPCPSVPCSIKKGSSVHVEIDFTPKEAVDNITTLVTGLIRDKEVQFRGIKANACADIVDATSGQSECPVQDLAKTYTFRTKLNVKASYPTLALIINWKLLGPKNETIVCFKISGEVVP